MTSPSDFCCGGPLAALLPGLQSPSGLAVLATYSAGLGACSAALSHAFVRPRLLRAALIFGAAAAFAWPLVPAGVPSLFGALLASAALFLLGASAVPEAPRSEGSAPLAAGLSRAGILVAAAWILDGAAAGWGAMGSAAPFSPEVAARLLDLSPRAIVMEMAGFDWMRDASVYEPVGTDRISPTLRTGFQVGGGGPLGVPIAVLGILVVGSVATGLRIQRSSGTSATPSGVH